MRSKRAFTIIELLVVVSIIALLIGILLPAITKARDQARLTMSQTNLRNLATAHATYASEWNDRQFTLIDDNMSSYGDTADEAFPEWHRQHGAGGNMWDHHPPILLGWRQGGLWGYWMDWAGNWGLPQPIAFTGSDYWIGFGAFRIPNAKQFNQYLSNRYYDPVFYAPKDTIAWACVEPCLDDPGEFCTLGGTENTYWSSYCTSPAAMFSPDVMRHDDPGNPNDGWQDPWLMASGFRSPSPSQALYPSLKTWMCEHHWLQNRKAECNPGFTGGTYDGCEPFYFNHGYESIPVAFFYDGHVASIGLQEAQNASNRNEAQTGWALWNPGCGDMGADGYFISLGYDQLANTSYHVLTSDGIRGRDTLGD